MISKTKLLTPVENDEKTAFWDFMVPNATLSETNALFCSDHGVELEIVTRNSSNINPIKLS